MNKVVLSWVNFPGNLRTSERFYPKAFNPAKLLCGCALALLDGDD